MRELKKDEIAQVSGAGSSCHQPPSCESSDKEKGNNGFGNGGHDGVPGNSDKQDCTR